MNEKITKIHTISDIELPHNHGSKHISRIPDTEQIQTVADALKLLGDTSRLRIFWLLCHCEECVQNIAALVDMSSPAVAHHLKLLKTDGLIVSRREGKEMYYKAADTELVKTMHHTIEKLAKITCPD